MTNVTVLPSRNTDYGFFGTLTTCPERDRRTSEAWSLASRLIAQAVNATSDEEMLGIRDFLDSRSGRHFADEVVGALQCGAPDCEAAITGAIAKWQDWRITRATERSDGIPAGLSYLTGWVQHFAVTATMDEQHCPCARSNPPAQAAASRQ